MINFFTDHVEHFSSADGLHCSAVFNIRQVNVIDLQNTIIHPVVKTT